MRGMICLRMGQLGSSLSTRFMKCGVMDMARRLPESMMPVRSSWLRLMCFSRSASEFILFLSCHL